MKKKVFFRLKCIFAILVYLVVFAGLLGMGRWQWLRYQEKKDMEDRYERRALLSTKAIKSIFKDMHLDWLYYPVEIAGFFDNEKSFFLDNQVVDRQIGFKVYTLFKTDEGFHILVDRGWMPRYGAAHHMPVLESISKRVVLRGLLWKPAGKSFLLQEDHLSQTWPKVVQAVDSMFGVFSKEMVFPWIVVLNEHQLGTYVYKMPMPRMRAWKHQSYAMQWWSMALVSIYLVVRYVRRNREKSNT